MLPRLFRITIQNHLGVSLALHPPGTGAKLYHSADPSLQVTVSSDGLVSYFKHFHLTCLLVFTQSMTVARFRAVSAAQHTVFSYPALFKVSMKVCCLVSHSLLLGLFL